MMWSEIADNGFLTTAAFGDGNIIQIEPFEGPGGVVGKGVGRGGARHDDRLARILISVKNYWNSEPVLCAGSEIKKLRAGLPTPIIYPHGLVILASFMGVEWG